MSERTPQRTRIRLQGDLSTFERMSQEERMRVFIRVLCELIAYGEPSDDQAAAGEPVTTLTDAA